MLARLKVRSHSWEPTRKEGGPCDFEVLIGVGTEGVCDRDFPFFSSLRTDVREYKELN